MGEGKPKLDTEKVRWVDFGRFDWLVGHNLVRFPNCQYKLPEVVVGEPGTRDRSTPTAGRRWQLVTDKELVRVVLLVQILK